MNFKGMRVGIPKEYLHPSMDVEIVELWKNTAKLMEEGGATVEEVSFLQLRVSCICDCDYLLVSEICISLI